MISNLLKKVDNLFLIKKNNSTISREILAGITTFSAMSYILVANPAILSNAGIDKLALITVTALAAAIGCIVVAFLSNLPIAVAPAMGSNAFFAFVICMGMGLKWQEAMGLVFYNGIFFLLISITGLREKFIKAVPHSLQVGLQAGIGLFIAFLGLQSSKLIVADQNTLVTFSNMNKPETIFALTGIALMSVLLSKKIRGAILLSIFIMTLLGFLIVGSDGNRISQMPTSIISMPESISSTFFQLDFIYLFENFSKAFPIVLILLILDMFDTLATVIAMGKTAGILDKKGNFPNISKVFAADSLATIFGALLGTSTTGSYVESAAGIHSGGRTGLTSLVVGILFLLSLFFTPIISIVPAEAVAPALIIVGILMLKSLSEIDFTDFAEFMPALFCMIMIMLSFKITEGFAFGIISYVILMLATKRAKKIHASTWVLFAIMCVFLSYM